MGQCACGRRCSGTICRECARDERWGEEFSRTLGDVDGESKQDDEPATDGGSKYVFATGEGYHTTRRVGKGGVGITLSDTNLDWDADSVRAVQLLGNRRLSVLDPDDVVGDPIDLVDVVEGQYSALQVRLKTSVVSVIGVESGDDIRVYEEESPDRLLVVPADDDPRIHGGGLGGD